MRYILIWLLGRISLAELPPATPDNKESEHLCVIYYSQDLWNVIDFSICSSSPENVWVRNVSIFLVCFSFDSNYNILLVVWILIIKLAFYAAIGQIHLFIYSLIINSYSQWTIVYLYRFFCTSFPCSSFKPLNSSLWIITNCSYWTCIINWNKSG